MRKTPTYLMILWLCLPAPALAARPDRYEEHLQQATALYTQERYQESLTELRAAYAMYPLPRLLYNQGQIYRKLGQNQDALESYDLFLRTEPHVPPQQRTDVERYIAALRRVEGPKAAPALAAAAVAPVLASPQPAPAAAPPPAPLRAALPALALTAEAPPPLPTRTRPDDRGGAARTAIYKRWWFWGAVGAVAAGTAAGIVAGTYHPAPGIPMNIPFHTEKN